MLSCSLLFVATVCLGLAIAKTCLRANTLLEKLILGLPLGLLTILAGAYPLGPVAGQVATISISIALAAILSFYAKADESKLEEALQQTKLSLGWQLAFGVSLLVALANVFIVEGSAAPSNSLLSNPLVACFTLNIYPPLNAFAPKEAYPWPYGIELILGALLPHGWDPQELRTLLSLLIAATSFTTILVVFKHKGTQPSTIFLLTTLPFILALKILVATTALQLEDDSSLSLGLAIFILYLIARFFESYSFKSSPQKIAIGLCLGISLGLYHHISPAIFLSLLLSTITLGAVSLIYSKERAYLLFNLGLLLTLALTLSNAYPLLANKAWLSIKIQLSSSQLGWGIAALALAPLTGVWLIHKRHWSGLTFWCFGIWAQLISKELAYIGLVALSIPLILFCCESYEEAKALKRQKFLSYLFYLGIVCLTIASGSRQLSPVLPQALQEQRETDPPRKSPSVAEIECAQALAQQILPGETVLTRLGFQAGDPEAVWQDSAISTLSGALIEGWDYTLNPGQNQSRIGQIKRSALFKAFKSSNRLELLWSKGIRWLILDPGQAKLEKALKASAYALLVKRSISPEGLKRELWLLSSPPSVGVKDLYSQPPFRTRCLLLDEGHRLPLATSDAITLSAERAYSIEIAAFNESSSYSRLGWLRVVIKKSEGSLATEPLYYLLGQTPLSPMTGDLQEVSFVTPAGQGIFTVAGELITGPHTASNLFSFPIEVRK